LSLPLEDFEDALVIVCAERANADFIVSRDDKFLLADSPVKLIAPKDFVNTMKIDVPDGFVPATW
jgi:predicted nucleic acid-binding protein